LGPLPPVKIHCAQLVEGALRSALGGEEAQAAQTKSTSPTLLDSFGAHAKSQTKVKVVLRATDAVVSASRIQEQR